MFNIFETFDRRRDVVGAARFVFGFPAILANIADGKLTTTDCEASSNHHCDRRNLGEAFRQIMVGS